MKNLSDTILKKFDTWLGETVQCVMCKELIHRSNSLVISYPEYFQQTGHHPGLHESCLDKWELEHHEAN